MSDTLNMQKYRDYWNNEINNHNRTIDRAVPFSFLEWANYLWITPEK